MNNFGFIITRHVNSINTNKYWNHSVKLLRTFYPDTKIVIIDDNSKQEYVQSDFEYNNVIVIQSEFPGRGEFLPYYYYLKFKFFENAVIIHDSVFIHKRIPFEVFNKYEVLPLWHFNYDNENIENVLRVSSVLHNFKILEDKLLIKNNIIRLPQLKWYGCFGSQSYIKLNFLQKINVKYNIINLVQSLRNRTDRCSLERIIGCIFYTESPQLYKIKSIFGDIMLYQKWCDLTFDKYITNLKKGTIPKAVLKVWTGR